MRGAPVFVVLVAVSGCAATATITTRDGRQTEAFITGGDQRHLLLQSQYGVDTVVKRADIGDIDHPGNVLAVVGGILGGSGALDLVVLGSMCASGASGSSSCGLLLGTMGGMTAVGAGLFVWGLWTWLTSKNAVTNSLTSPPLPESLTADGAAPEPTAPPPLPLVPTPAPGL
ncbi:MAG: hypothetical protein JNJ54_32410 [Myxococcaceae bacterium]|nr:hypothetical protein [Myxococcaceae bacterium]